MMDSAKGALIERANIVQALPPTTPSSASPEWVSLKNHNRMTVIISVNNSTSVTGSAIALSQATAVAGTGAKTLAFTRMWANTDAANSAVFTETAVTSNTFTTTTTNSAKAVYVIDIRASDLDVNGGFDCVRVTCGNAANTVIDVIYVLEGTRFANAPGLVDAMAD